ncbi:HEPN domain-containing protein [Micromonospora sp. NPDC049101]|uniref:HEPN domain-containing protein n=1 Tax=Micromonospora sp. NPDC049101 TaxID=3155032 RepID=UPI0034022296
MNSPRYRELSRRITELRDHFLPARFDPTGSYSERVHDRVRAFRLLAHAEVESFLEDRAVQVANSAFTSWSGGAAPKPCLLALLAFEEAGREAPTSLIKRPQKRAPDLAGRVSRAKNQYATYVKSRNHGVKEENILRILLPLGVRESDIDHTWLLSLESWGSTRGELAHRSKKVQSPLDPLTEWNTVCELVRGARNGRAVSSFSHTGVISAFRDVDLYLGNL